MGISLGSSSKKPYVGSKEVQEAYVGSQLVYQNAPPFVYAFLGNANDYVIADWCQLTRYAAVKKYEGIYRITVNAGVSGGEYGTVTLDISQLKKKNKIEFDYKADGGVAYNFYCPLKIGEKIYSLPTSNTYKHAEYTIPAGVNSILFQISSNKQYIVDNALILNSIRIE